MAILWTLKVVPIWKITNVWFNFFVYHPPLGQESDVPTLGHHICCPRGGWSTKKLNHTLLIMKLVQLSMFIKWPFLNEIPSIFFSKWTIFCGEFEFRLDILSSWSGPPKIGKMKCGTFPVTKWPVCSEFSPFFCKVYYFWWGIWILSEEILKLICTPKKLNVHEWLIWVIFTRKSSDLYASQNGLCLMNFADFFFQSELFLVGNPNFVWSKFEIEVDPRKTQCAWVTHLSDFQLKICSTFTSDSYEWFSVEK